MKIITQRPFKHSMPIIGPLADKAIPDQILQSLVSLSDQKGPKTEIKATKRFTLFVLSFGISVKMLKMN